jgi:hypothetical protein
LEPQSLADPSRKQVRQPDAQAGRGRESVSQAADRLRYRDWIARIRETARLASAARIRETARRAGADAPIVAPSRDADCGQEDA